MGTTLAKRREKNSGKKPEPEAQEDGEKEAKYTSMARMRPEFQHRLARVAKDAGMKVGEFVELHLGDLVNQEYRRIVLAEAEQVRGEE